MLRPLITTWIDDLWAARSWDQVQDTPRIEQAFAHVRRDTMRWPTMRDFLKCFPRPEATPQAHRPFDLEWHKGAGKNNSLTAKAHITFNCHRLGLPIPDWAVGESAAESEAILTLVAQIKQEQVEYAETLRRDSPKRERAEARDVGDDQDDDAGIGDLDDGTTPDRPARHLSRDALAACVGWEVYRDDAGRTSHAAASR
jgi:hypothetical protein